MQCIGAAGPARMARAMTVRLPGTGVPAAAVLAARRDAADTIPADAAADGSGPQDGAAPPAWRVNTGSGAAR